MYFYRLAIVFLVAILLFHLGCSSHSEAQIRRNSNNIANARDVNQIENKALVVSDTDVQADIETLADLLKQPVPKLRFIFDCKESDFKNNQCVNNFSSTLPTSVESSLKDYWAASLKFRYQYHIEEFSAADADYKASSDFANTTQEFTDKLREAKLLTNKGERQISSDEAGEVARILNLRSTELVMKLN